jgi:hypothetical protein
MLPIIYSKTYTHYKLCRKLGLDMNLSHNIAKRPGNWMAKVTLLIEMGLA